MFSLWYLIITKQLELALTSILAQVRQLCGIKLFKCGALVSTQLLGIKENTSKKIEEPFWKRRIESKTKALHKDVSLTERWETGMLRKESQKTRLDICIKLKGKGIKEQLKKLSNALNQKLPL